MKVKLEGLDSNPLDVIESLSVFPYIDLFVAAGHNINIDRSAKYWYSILFYYLN